ncbi:MAG: HepT-like ribonuclease domain-containing protein [Dictyoglomaceae bacterium]
MIILLRTSTYKEIALALAKENIIPENFVKEKLVKMAGYRNRLIHFYSEVSLEELYSIIQNNIKDFEEFLKYIKELLENPEKFGFKIL